MRIQGGINPLDGTSVHPESYEAAGKLLEKQGFKPEDIAGGKLAGLSLTIKDYKKLAEELGIGEITFGILSKSWKNRRVIHEMRCRNQFSERMSLI